MFRATPPFSVIALRFGAGFLNFTSELSNNNIYHCNLHASLDEVVFYPVDDFRLSDARLFAVTDFV